jgi:hypothetical protein
MDRHCPVKGGLGDGGLGQHRCLRSRQRRLSASRLVALSALLGVPLGTLTALAPVVLLAAPASASAGAACTGTIAGVVVTGGSAQTAKVGTGFSSALQAEVVDTGGCPISNVDVEFVAPTSGPSATFPGAATNATVETGTNGVATAPTLTANDVSGSYTVLAEVANTGIEADFNLTNTTAGVASGVKVTSGNDQSAKVGTQFALPLTVNVLDAYGDPVPDDTVSFTVITTSGAGATFVGGGSSATAQTSESGTAASPLLVAGSTVGPFTVTASVGGLNTSATFSLKDVASGPYAMTAGAGSSQVTELGTDFAVPLAVTVTDSDGNAVTGASVTFNAPASGPSGVFAGHGASAVVQTDSNGVAAAPDFSAGEVPGGYIVTAKVAGLAGEATFALVNTARTTASVSGPAGTYWLVTSAGRVLTSGGAANYGSVPGKPTSRAVGIAATPGGHGYWVTTSGGQVFAFGNAKLYGSPAKLHLKSPIVGIAAAPDGKGYWLVASDGGIFNYGDAGFRGSPAQLHLKSPIVGIAATPDGKGYWLVASDGGIFNYGDASFHGSTGNIHLSKPIVGIAATTNGQGYWLVASDGGIFAFGGATFYGSQPSVIPQPVKALVTTPDGDGYWVISANGTAAGFGDAGAQGSPSPAGVTVVGGAA